MVNKILVNNSDSNYTHSIFDISEYTGQQYSTLSDALNAIPQAKHKGGMTIRYVPTNDNKYVQARCMAQNFTTDVTQWQAVDDEPTANSENLVKSGGVIELLENEYVSQKDNPADLDFSDNSGNIVARFDKGHIKTKNFSSEEVYEKFDELDSTIDELDLTIATRIPNIKDNLKNNGDLLFVDEEDNIVGGFKDGCVISKHTPPYISSNYNTISDLDVEDNKGNKILRIVQGYPVTKNFDAKNINNSFWSKSFIIKEGESFIINNENVLLGIACEVLTLRNRHICYLSPSVFNNTDGDLNTDVSNYILYNGFGYDIQVKPIPISNFQLYTQKVSLDKIASKTVVFQNKGHINSVEVGDDTKHTTYIPINIVAPKKYCFYISTKSGYTSDVFACYDNDREEFIGSTTDGGFCLTDYFVDESFKYLKVQNCPDITKFNVVISESTRQIDKSSIKVEDTSALYPFVSASTIGISPENDGATNTNLINSAILEHHCVYFDVPGIYEIETAINLENDTWLEFCKGCTIKKVGNNTAVFWTNYVRGEALDVNPRHNITIKGNGLVIDINGMGSLNGGQIQFYNVDRVHVEGIIVDDDISQFAVYAQYFCMSNYCSNMYFKDIDLTYSKDGIDFAGCENVIIENYSAWTQDDNLFFGYGWLFQAYFNAFWHTSCRNFLIKNWRIKSKSEVGSSVSSCGLRFIAASWDNWKSGAVYSGGYSKDGAECVVANGKVYRNATDGNTVSTEEPNHASGAVTYSDGITWVYLRDFDGSYTCDMENFIFEDCDLRYSKSFLMYEDWHAEQREHHSHSEITFIRCVLPYMFSMGGFDSDIKCYQCVYKHEGTDPIGLISYFGPWEHTINFYAEDSLFDYYGVVIQAYNAIPGQQINTKVNTKFKGCSFVGNYLVNIFAANQNRPVILIEDSAMSLSRLTVGNDSRYPYPHTINIFRSIIENVVLAKGYVSNDIKIVLRNNELLNYTSTLLNSTVSDSVTITGKSNISDIPMQNSLLVNNKNLIKIDDEFDLLDKY